VSAIDLETNLQLMLECAEQATDSRYASQTLRWAGPAAVLDACAVAASYGDLLVLTADGVLHGLNLDSRESAPLCTVHLPVLPEDDGNNHFGKPRHRLHASADGRHAAIVVDQGQHGIVFETQSGASTMQLHGGDYHEDTVPFSACFVRFRGANVLVHRTAWNRLDAADPATGKSLTDRCIPPYEAGAQRPPHDLDYFHGRLLPSPEGGLIFDDGWVWHPISIPRIWSVTGWLAMNPWESEDGASLVDLARREDWTQPACWIDEQHIALWGAGEWDFDESEEVQRGPGVQIFDVTGAKPSRREWWPMAGVQNAKDLFSDGKRLYLVSEGGTKVLDIESRDRVDEFPGFIATLIHRSRGALVSFGADAIREIRAAR
jgi:hypothetical protein